MNRRAFVLGAALVLLGSVVIVALRTFAEAAFLAAYGPAQVPWLLVANAAAFAAATLGYDLLTRRARTGAVDVLVLGALAVVAGAAPRLVTVVPPAVLVVALVALSQVAGLALWNRVGAALAGRDARRYLPRAGAASTLGAAVAGLGAGALIPHVGLSAIPVLAGVLVLVVLGLCVAQDRAFAAGGAPGLDAAPAAGTRPAARAARAPAGLTSLQRALVAAMLAVAVLESVVMTVIDLQFIASVKARYTGDDVAVVLALFYGGMNAVLLVLQGAAVPHVLVTRAMTFTTGLHPALVVLSYVGFAIAPGFAAIAGTRTADQVLRFATSRPAQELELEAMPAASRARWKVLLRGAAAPATSAATALGLLLLGPALLHHPAVAGAVIALALGWLLAARVAARRFQVALAAPLGIKRTQHEDPRRIELETLERWTRAAGSDDPRHAALARAALARVRVDATDLAEHLRHDDPAVRAALFDQLVRAPAPTLRGELRAAVAIEDDDRALALAIKALAISGDDAGLARGKARPGLSRVVDDAVRTSAVLLHASTPTSQAHAATSGGELARELDRVLADDPAWAAALVRAHGEAAASAVADQLAAAAARDEVREHALIVIARLAPPRAVPLLAAALERGEPAARHALTELDDTGAAALAHQLATFSPPSRVTMAHALAAAPAAATLLGELLDDRDPEVAHAALRSALAVARGGGTLPPARVAAAFAAALSALLAYLDARDALAAASRPEGRTWSPCARVELAVATRRCVARVLWASAVEAALAGRDPGPFAAAARHLLGARDAERRRALDVVQELEARPQLITALERWLVPARPAAARDPSAALAGVDPWLVALAAGGHVEIESTLADLRRAALFASIAGPALAAIAARTARRTLAGTLALDRDTMLVVVAGEPAVRRAQAPARHAPTTLPPGSVVGELAMLARGSHEAAVALEGAGELLAISRGAFADATHRAPELVLGLAAALAGSLAPDHPDVL